MMGRFSGGAGLIVLGATVVAAFASPQQQQPTFRSGTQVIEIDVRVFSKDGRFVTDLTRDDFEILEDGAPQQLQTFFFVDGVPIANHTPQLAPQQPSVSTSVSSPRPRQTWIFFFDLNHLTPGTGYDRAKKAVEDFIRDRFIDGDLAGVVAGEKMLNNRLTSIRQEVLDGMKQIKPRAETRNRNFELTRDWPRFLDEEEVIRSARNEADVVRRVAGRACQDDPDFCRAGDPEPAVRGKAIRMQQEIHRQTLLTLQSLNALSNGLAKIPGPKTIVFLSDGFTVQDIETTLRSVVGQTARAGARVYAIDVRGINRAGSGIIDQAHAEDPYGAVTKFDTLADAPNSLAVDTGGMMIRNENNIGRALATIAADANRYYVLGFQSSNTNWDGKFRQVQVRVKRDAVRVRARRGYLAIEPARITVPEPVSSTLSKDTEVSPIPPGARLGSPESPVVPVPVPDAPAGTPPATGKPTGLSEDTPPGTLRMRPDAAERVRELSGTDTVTATSKAAELAQTGWAAYQRGDIEAAIGPLTEAASEPDVRPWVLYALGLSQGALGRPRDAIVSWERVRATAPEFEAVYIDLAATHASLSDLSPALAVLRDAETRWPKDPEIHNAIGVIHFRRGALDEAVDAFTAATTVAPTDALAYLNLGRAYELRFNRSRRYVTSQRRWVVDEGDRRKSAESYEAYLKLGGPYEQSARDGLQRLEWSK
jgi:VWFA-related protein